MPAHVPSHEVTAAVLNAVAAAAAAAVSAIYIFNAAAPRLYLTSSSVSSSAVLDLLVPSVALLRCDESHPERRDDEPRDPRDGFDLPRRRGGRVRT